MPLGLIGKKVGMTRVFLKDGTAIPVTVIKFEPNYVVQVKTVERDGYNAIKVGSDPILNKKGEPKWHKVTKPIKGELEKAGIPVPLRRFKEFKVDNPQDFKPGQLLKVEDVFKPGDVVDVRGTSKGRGFAGAMKRWDFGGFPKSHGHRYHRAVGAIGQRSDPGRVWKGKKMPGHWGNEPVTVQGLLVVDVVPEESVILVKGSVPGWNRGTVYVYHSTIANRRKKQLKTKREMYIVENLLKVEEGKQGEQTQQESN
ncbi:MAG: 50S ribosomal protein L3 [Aquificaceae bacterium]|nr:MAG: 50S ribosomal protein L3 [Aquificaceae bacterium]